MQNLIKLKLSAAVQELSCSQSSDHAENNTAVASAGSNKVRNRVQRNRASGLTSGRASCCQLGEKK